MIGEGIKVITGDNDSSLTYQRSNAAGARLLFANCEDTTNTNITITAREIAADLPIAAIVEEEDSIDVLEQERRHTRAPAEAAARRVSREPRRYRAGRAHHRHAPWPEDRRAAGTRHDILAGRTVRDTRLREKTGLSVVGLWERGKLRPAFPDSVIQPSGVVVLAGTDAQITAPERDDARRRPDTAARAHHRRREGGRCGRTRVAAEGVPRSTPSIATDSALALMADEGIKLFPG